MKRGLRIVVPALLATAILVVVEQAVQTLHILTAVERDRDTWQRPNEIIRALDVAAGNTVVDVGSGAGYFTLRIAPHVTPGGRVIAVDLRRQSLAFLWIRTVWEKRPNVDVVHGRVDDPRLPRGTIDAALIANTYHELAAPEPILKALFVSMRSGGRLVVVDRGPRAATDSRIKAAEHHEITAAVAEREIVARGFETVTRDDRFIDRSQDDDVWWIVVFRKP